MATISNGEPMTGRISVLIGGFSGFTRARSDAWGPNAGPHETTAV